MPKRKKEILQTSIVTKVPKISLFRKKAFDELIEAINKGDAKIRQLNKETFPDVLKIDKITVKIDKENNTAIYYLDENIGTPNYLAIWNRSSARWLLRDSRKENYEKYYTILYSVSDNMKKALVRKMDEDNVLDSSVLEEASKNELKNKVLEISNYDTVNFKMQGNYYAIIKIVNIDETWTQVQKNYNPEDLEKEYEDSVRIELDSKNKVQEEKLF